MIIPQKCLLYDNTAFPLLNSTEDVLPQSGDKCLLIRDRNLCIPVYQNAGNQMLTDGNSLNTSFAEDEAKEKSIQEFSKNSSVF